MVDLFLNLIKEAHKHPLFTLFLALVFTGWIMFSLNHFAIASDVDKVKNNVMVLQYTIKKSALEQQIHSVESEIFALERFVAEGNARDIDHERLAKLLSQLGTLKRDILSLENIDSLGAF